MTVCSNEGCEAPRAANQTRCREHYNAYMRVYTLERYHRRRAEYISQLGGVCVICGAEESLEFDHIDARTKTADISKLLNGASKATLDAEISKCQLLCRTCHVEKSQQMRDTKFVDHGEGLTGKRNCRCEKCGPLKNAYMRKFKQNAKLKAEQSSVVKSA